MNRGVLPDQSRTGLRRRRFLQSLAVATAAGGLLGARPAAAESADLASWFSNVSNYDGVVDERGSDTVEVAVGASANGGGFGFGPAAVRVAPGTTVVWEWTGEGGAHNVVDEDGAFESDLVGEKGHTFEYTFESEGISLYYCSPHKAMGMKGAVVVGDVEVAAAPPSSASDGPNYVAREPDYGGWFDGVSNFAGTVDARGLDEVRVTVGPTADDAPSRFAFAPPAIHVDPGTAVIWEWTGEAGEQVVRAADGSYESPALTEGEYGLTFDGVGISKYASTTHGDGGMRGAVVVGDVFAGTTELTVGELTVLGAYGTAILGTTAFGAVLWAKRNLGHEAPRDVADEDTVEPVEERDDDEIPSTDDRGPGRRPGTAD